jgi:hypothetical protein
MTLRTSLPNTARTTTGDDPIEPCGFSRPTRIIPPRTLPTDGSSADPSWVAYSTSTNAHPEPQLSGRSRVWNPTGPCSASPKHKCATRGFARTPTPSPTGDSSTSLRIGRVRDFDDPAIPDAPRDTTATATVAAALVKLGRRAQAAATVAALRERLGPHGDLVDGCGVRDAQPCRRPDLVGQRRGSGTCGPRSGRNAARSSAANSSGSSQAAKWPPRSASPK